MTQLDRLRDALRSFTSARDWDQFHSPKNLAMALSVEAAELLEVFQWVTESDSRNLEPGAKAAASEEIADVLLYLILLSDELGIESDALLLGQPLKLLDELGGLDRQRHREILRRVKLLPIARRRERGEPLLQRA